MIFFYSSRHSPWALSICGTDRHIKTRKQGRHIKNGHDIKGVSATTTHDDSWSHPVDFLFSWLLESSEVLNHNFVFVQGIVTLISLRFTSPNFENWNTYKNRKLNFYWIYNDSQNT